MIAQGEMLMECSVLIMVTRGEHLAAGELFGLLSNSRYVIHFSILIP
jgi:hypothetical protein